MKSVLRVVRQQNIHPCSLKNHDNPFRQIDKCGTIWGRLTLPTTYFGRPTGPGPWLVEVVGISSEVVVAVTVTVVVAVAVAVDAVVDSVVSSLIVVVCIVVSVAGPEVELVDGGL